MKKLCGILLILGLLFAMPLNTNAEVRISEADMVTPISEEVNEADGTVTKTHALKLTTSANETVKDITITLIAGPAVKELTCAGAGDFTLKDQTSDAATRTYKCTFESAGTTSEKFDFGTFKILVNKDANNEDCAVQVALEGASGPAPNPETGAMVPYLALGAGAVLAVGLILATKNKTRLQKI